MRALRSFGLIDKMFRDYYPPYCIIGSGKVNSGNDELRPLGLEQLQGAFWIFLIGNACSVILFAFERFKMKKND